jgi:hypothetical protein
MEGVGCNVHPIPRIHRSTRLLRSCTGRNLHLSSTVIVVETSLLVCWCVVEPIVRKISRVAVRKGGSTALVCTAVAFYRPVDRAPEEKRRSGTVRMMCRVAARCLLRVSFRSRDKVELGLVSPRLGGGTR